MAPTVNGSFSKRRELRNVAFPTSLLQLAKTVARERELSFTELVNRALSEYVQLVEEEKLVKELAEGYEANYELDRKINKEWKVLDIEQGE